MSIESEVFNLTLNQQFQIEHYSRVIDNLDDKEQLREIAKLMLGAYERQRSATRWILQHHLNATRIDWIK